MKLRVAILTTDNRGPFQQHHLERPWFGMAPEALLQGLEEIPELEVHVVSCIRKRVNAPEKIGRNIWFHSLVVPKIGWIRTGYSGCLIAVRRRLRRIQPHLVHGHGSETEGAMCAAFSGYPNVITPLGIMREMARITHARPGSFYWLSSLLEGIAFRRSLGVLGNSRYTIEKVRDRARRVWLVPNAIREAFFFEPLPQTPPSECLLLNIGTVTAYKQQNELLDVFEQLHREGLRFKARFLGLAGRQGAYGARFLDRIQNSPYIAHSGFQSLPEVISEMDAASGLVHVSQIESFGLVVAEALARNLKFAGFCSGGVADIVETVDGAECFAGGDWEGLRTSLSRWIKAGAPRPTQAAATIRARYHPSEIARQHLRVYREALGWKG
jgi:glycosyltransferase involved in cell wall biosynthesis